MTRGIDSFVFNGIAYKISEQEAQAKKIIGMIAECQNEKRRLEQKLELMNYAEEKLSGELGRLLKKEIAKREVKPNLPANTYIFTGTPSAELPSTAVNKPEKEPDAFPESQVPEDILKR